jgi:adenosine deaminase CECR1
MAMPDEIWEELSQDIPATSDPFVQQYLAGRASLIAQEQTTRSDASFRSGLSPVAKHACDIVDRIRRHEMDTIWTPGVEEALARDTASPVFPGMMFRLAKDRMEGTRLWDIVQRMPKGALLHAHLDAMVSFDFVLAEMLATPGMHMASDRALSTADARASAALEFRYRAREKTDASIWAPDYQPDTHLLLTSVADSFPDGGRAGFLAWLKSRCTLSVEDSHEQHHGVNAIWEKFAKCFMVVESMIHYEPVFRSILRRLLRDLKADNVNWAELRMTWPLNYCREKQEVPEKDYDHIFQVIEEETNRFKASPEGEGFWGITIIWTF